MLILGGLILPLLRGQAALARAPRAAAGHARTSSGRCPTASRSQVPFLGYELALVKGDALSRLFATVFALMAFAGGLFALNQNRVVELAAAFCYAGSAIGVVFAGDLLTVFIFWELMAIASTLVVWSAGPSARGRRTALCRDPSARRRSADGRHRRRDRRDRLARLRQDGARHACRAG